jgi:hypothetical protein
MVEGAGRGGGEEETGKKREGGEQEKEVGRRKEWRSRVRQEVKDKGGED